MSELTDDEWEHLTKLARRLDVGICECGTLLLESDYHLDACVACRHLAYPVGSSVHARGRGWRGNRPRGIVGRRRG